MNPLPKPSPSGIPEALQRREPHLPPKPSPGGITCGGSERRDDQWTGACGKPIENLDEVYRCLDCNLVAHKECLRKHCAASDEKDAEIARLTKKRDEARHTKTITFEEAWKRMEAKGYQYGPDALEQVKLGWELRQGIEDADG